MKVKSIAECSNGEHSAILLTCIKQYLVLNFFFGLFEKTEWPFFTGFTVLGFQLDLGLLSAKHVNTVVNFQLVKG